MGATGSIFRFLLTPEGGISVPKPNVPDPTSHLRLAGDGQWDTSPTGSAPLSPPFFQPQSANFSPLLSPEPGFAARHARNTSAIGPASTQESVLQQLDALRSENAMLRAEVHHLRRRDDTVKTQMTRIDEEMRLAARLQRDFMPRVLPKVKRCRFHSLYRPANYVSGDLYDVSRLDEQHVGFYMGDAVGHGMPAALLTMFMRQALQTKDIGDGTYRLLPPGETLERLNESMVEQDLSQSTFATAVCGLINVDTGALMLAGGGHPAPLVIPKEGNPYELETEGTLLGVFSGEKYPDIKGQLNPGDRLIIYTDGVEVAFPMSGTDSDQPLYDNDRWKRELIAVRHLPAEEMLYALSSKMDEQEGSLSPGDDLTMIILDYNDHDPTE